MAQPEAPAGGFRSDEQQVVQDSPSGFADAQAVHKPPAFPSGEAICQEGRSFRALLGMPGGACDQSHGADIGQLRGDSSPDLTVRRMAPGQ
jgi:hypothetical protein